MRGFVLLCALVMVAMPAFAECGADCTGDCCATKFTGFVDGAYIGQLEQSSHEFSLEQAEIDVTRNLQGNLAVRGDFEWVKSGNGWALDVEQAYVNYSLPMFPQVTWSFGKFNAPIGLEMLDAPDMYQYSHSLVFNNCLPTNLVGVMGAVDLTEQFDLLAYITNGWDQNSDVNEAKTFGGRLGFSHEWIGIGLSGIMGSEDVDQDYMQTVYDIDVTLTPTDNLLIGGEFNIGTISSDLDGVDDVGWTGFLIMANYGFTDWMSLTLRYDSVDDADGALFGAAGNGEFYTRSSLTLAPNFDLGHGMAAVLEYRMDMAGEDIFLDADDEPTGSNSMVVWEMVYTF